MKKLAVAIVILLLLCAGAGWVLWQRMHAAPEAARLLPDSDAMVYLNLRPLHLASIFASLPNVERDPEYDKFVQATGFEFERDLDEAAIAVHLPPRQALSTSPGFFAEPQAQPAANTASETRFSEVFIGKFDTAKVETYFRGIAHNTEHYRGREIYTMPVEGRTVRLAMLTGDMVGISNVADASVIHGIVDRAREESFFIPNSGPELVREHYDDVPFGSLAWAVTKPTKNLPLPSGFEVPLPADVAWVASVRYAGDIELEAQGITASEDDAKQVADSLNSVLQLAHTIAQGQTRGHDADAKNLFDGVQVKQENKKAVVTASVSLGFIQKMARSLAQMSAAPEVAPEPAPALKKKGTK